MTVDSIRETKTQLPTDVRSVVVFTLSMAALRTTASHIQTWEVFNGQLISLIDTEHLLQPEVNTNSKKKNLSTQCPLFQPNTHQINLSIT